MAKKTQKTNYGANIKKLRIKLGLYQREFANLLGVSCPAISAYERNIIMPSLKVALEMERIAKENGLNLEINCFRKI